MYYFTLFTLVRFSVFTLGDVFSTWRRFPLLFFINVYFIQIIQFQSFMIFFTYSNTTVHLSFWRLSLFYTVYLVVIFHFCNYVRIWWFLKLMDSFVGLRHQDLFHFQGSAVSGVSVQHT
uniref:Putative secreted protein n=1 Tax=Ixodes ricinus TaxID=34613 RepID=A0A6B0UMM3_IXORI